jgi:hypothetical protein
MHEDLISSDAPLAPAGGGLPTMGGGQVLTGTQENEEIIERVAALDIGQGGPGVLCAGAR